MHCVRREGAGCPAGERENLSGMRWQRPVDAERSSLHEVWREGDGERTTTGFGLKAIGSGPEAARGRGNETTG